MHTTFIIVAALAVLVFFLVRLTFIRVSSKLASIVVRAAHDIIAREQANIDHSDVSPETRAQVAAAKAELDAVVNPTTVTLAGPYDKVIKALIKVGQERAAGTQGRVNVSRELVHSVAICIAVSGVEPDLFAILAQLSAADRAFKNQDFEKADQLARIAVQHARAALGTLPSSNEESK